MQPEPKNEPVLHPKELMKDLVEEQYLDIHEAAEILEVSENEIWKLVQEHKIPSHNIAGAFLRFKKNELEEVKNKWRIDRELFAKDGRYFAHESTFKPPTLAEKLGDFWYFNDFYVLCSALCAVLLYFILSSQ